MNTYKKILSIDYGTKRIGVAISRGSLAEPLMIVANNLIGKSHDSKKITVVSPDALERLVQVSADNEVDHIVVGISENTTAEKTKLFVKELQKNLDAHTGVPTKTVKATVAGQEVKAPKIKNKISIEFFDETLSSQEVHNRLNDKGIKKKKRQSYIDHFAAAVILEEWLEIHG